MKGFKLTSLTPEEIWPVLTNCMEIHCANLLSRLPIDKSVALDVGGSYGFYALLLSRLVGDTGQVYSFEPDWSNFEALTRNIVINNCKNVSAVPICLSNEFTGLARWKSRENEPWNSSLLPGNPTTIESQRPIAVPVTTIDEFLRIMDLMEEVHFIKIDVEGAEGMVLEGARSLLRRTKPLILCELHGTDIAKRVFEFLKENNYTWKTVEYMNESRHHIFAFPSDQIDSYYSLIP